MATGYVVEIAQSRNQIYQVFVFPNTVKCLEVCEYKQQDPGMLIPHFTSRETNGYCIILAVCRVRRSRVEWHRVLRELRDLETQPFPNQQLHFLDPRPLASSGSFDLPSARALAQIGHHGKINSIAIVQFVAPHAFLCDVADGLADFKSYKGEHVLLFGDSFFTSIIGPNGSGKSNSWVVLNRFTLRRLLTIL